MFCQRTTSRQLSPDAIGLLCCSVRKRRAVLPWRSLRDWSYIRGCRDTPWIRHHATSPDVPPLGTISMADEAGIPHCEFLLIWQSILQSQVLLLRLVLMTSGLDQRWDAVVIGGSAAGLSAALMLGRARRRVLVIDAGSPRNRFAHHMHGVLGHEGKAPSELTRIGQGEVAVYGGHVVSEKVVNVDETPQALNIALADGTHHSARALVVASGSSDRLPEIPGLAERWGTSVLHCPYCHGWEVRDQALGVLATSQSALHQAQLVRQWSDKVTLFSAALGELEPEQESRLRARGVQINTSPVSALVGDGPRLTGVQTDADLVEVQAIFTAPQPVPHDDFLAPLGLARTEFPMGLGSFLAVDAAGRTSNPRVWAVGNVVNPMANVPMSMGAGSLTGGAVNGALVEEEFDEAVRLTSLQP